MTYAAEISAPLLILRGDSDPVVPLSSTLDLAERMRSAGGEVELVVYEGEGHGFRDPEHQRDEYRRIGEFLAGVVGAR